MPPRFDIPPLQSNGNAIVLNNAMLGFLESSRVCWTMIGTLDVIKEAYAVLRGMVSGSLRSLNRRCFVRRAGTRTRKGPAGSRSSKKTMISMFASSSEALSKHAASWDTSSRLFGSTLSPGMYPSGMAQSFLPNARGMNPQRSCERDVPWRSRHGIPRCYREVFGRCLRLRRCRNESSLSTSLATISIHGLLTKTRGSGRPE